MIPARKVFRAALPLLPVLSVACKAQQQQQRPNVLFILTDDQGWGDVRAHGNPLINTPSIDRLHDESVVMDRFFVSPLSAPTRASLLTGRYHLRTGVSSVQSGLENMRPEETTLAELFRGEGYATGCFGKWHNGTYYPYTPVGQGFDEFVGFCCGHWPNYFDPPLQRGEETFRGNGYITDIITDEAIDFIERHKEGPFFCYVPYNAPHSPFMVPDRYYDKYRDLHADNERDGTMLASIYGMIECVDDNIARLLATLEKEGLRDNTIVVFVTDNGPVHVVRYNGGMRGVKGTVDEGGVRVPCYVNWPGTLVPKKIEGNAAHIDMLPTLMELCGISDYTTAFPVDGRSFARNLRSGEPIASGRTIFTHRKQNELAPWLGAARSDRYRLTLYPGDKASLYDMLNDPAQSTDIYDPDDGAHKGLYDAYMAWWKEASRGVALDTDVPVGYSQAPQVRIPSPEGRMAGALKCYGYPNQNWVEHFRTSADSLSYTLDVVEEGRYEIVLEYNNTDAAQATAHARISDGRLTSTAPRFESQIISPAPRADVGEKPEKSWSRLSLGMITLSRGLHPLTVWFDGVSSPNAVQVKTIIVNRK